MQINSGTLSLAGGGNSTGSFSGAGTLQVGSDYTFAAGSSIRNSNVVFNPGAPDIVNVLGTYDLVGSSTTVSSGTTNFTGNLVNVGDLTITGGTANFSSGETIAPTSLRPKAISIGLAVFFRKVPVEAYVEILPGFVLTDNDWFDVGGSIGGRYYFGVK